MLFVQPIIYYLISLRILPLFFHLIFLSILYFLWVSGHIFSFSFFPPCWFSSSSPWCVSVLPHFLHVREVPPCPDSLHGDCDILTLRVIILLRTQPKPCDDVTARTGHQHQFNSWKKGEKDFCVFFKINHKNNPSNAEATTFIQSTRMQRFLNTI